MDEEQQICFQMTKLLHYMATHPKEYEDDFGAVSETTGFSQEEIIAAILASKIVPKNGP